MTITRITRVWYDYDTGVWYEKEIDPAEFFSAPAKTEWTPPTVRRFSAGDAETPGEECRP